MPENEIVMHDEEAEFSFRKAMNKVGITGREKFNPDEPRDEHGRWTGDGGESESHPESDHPGHGYSDSAKIIDGVIHTDNVYDAARALYEGRPVELSQPDEIATLLTHLGKVTETMVRLGASAPNFDL